MAEEKKVAAKKATKKAEAVEEVTTTVTTEEILEHLIEQDISTDDNSGDEMLAYLDEQGNVIKITCSRSFTANLIQAAPKVREYYNDIKIWIIIITR